MAMKTCLCCISGAIMKVLYKSYKVQLVRDVGHGVMLATAYSITLQHIHQHRTAQACYISDACNNAYDNVYIKCMIVNIKTLLTLSHTFI